MERIPITTSEAGFEMIVELLENTLNFKLKEKDIRSGGNASIIVKPFGSIEITIKEEE